MGDMLELGVKEEEFHRQAGQDAAKVCDILVTVGKLSELAAEAARGNGFQADKIFTCDSSDAAREVINHKIVLSRDDVVLVKGSRAMKMEKIFQE